MRTNSHFITVIVGSILSLSSLTATASIRASGSFTATGSCDAYQSFRKQTNPDNTQLVSNKQYAIKAINKKEFDWVQILIPTASPAMRWVSKSCGKTQFNDEVTFKPSSSASNSASNSASKQCDTRNDFDSYVLALTWQPGFCEHFKYKGNKPECTAINDGKLNITHLTLHGLWPNKSSCGTKYGYCDRYARLDLSTATIKEIAPWMPNFYYQTKFGEYEWKKHGTCQNLDDDAYFLTATKLVEKVDASAIGQFIKANIGNNVSTASFKKNLISHFGADAVDRISLACSQGRYLNEVRLNIGKSFNVNNSVQQLLESGPKGRPFYGNCHKKIYIEAAGK
ncbi:Ribonuclease I precursor [Photobacterium malacitanum]|uniref:Ribonuclease I n=1 Tax=Photobacterium malacitanum TaxID=2204294 RepID=A0A1Y6M6W8_9GAMM|nr:ribonuclease T2 [Photobacterium malacitanum]SMY32302.1 Ribonuclease I precursor [Photobacterium malacitanum]